jgi:anthranilate synthase/aminodeoxychorismate synthase-like glutamine amidotransferase
VILLIDNYDSFTYNLVQFLGELGLKGYVAAKDIEVYRNDKITLNEIERLSPTHIVISPGPGVPKRAGISNDLIKRFAGKIPILGVCLGHQCIGEVFGGVIKGAPRLMHGKTSLIHHDGEGVYKGLPNPFVATRYHSLIIEKETLPSCLVVSAWTEEGEVMGVRHNEYDIEGVQFHPESILTEVGKDLLKNFITLYPKPSVQV